jgi:hypothetical protein
MVGLYVFPVATEVPPVAAVNQLMVPADAVAESETTPVPHTEPGVVAVMVGIGSIVAKMAVRVAATQPFTLRGSA